MPRPSRVQIDAFPESAFRYLECDALVCIDVIDATTMMVTGAHQGRPVLPAATPEEARKSLGHLGASLFSMPSSPTSLAQGIPIGPAALARLDETERPLVVCGPGAQLVLNASSRRAVYVASFQNLTATAAAVARIQGQVTLIAAGEGSESRCEDEMAAARIRRLLLEKGYEPANNDTADLIARWGDVELTLARFGKSVEGLRRSGRSEDADFILAHLDDLDLACGAEEGEVCRVESVLTSSSGEFTTARRRVGARAEATL